MSTKLINGFQRCIMPIFQCSLLLTCVEASSAVSTAVPATTSATAPVATTSTSVAIAVPATVTPAPAVAMSTTLQPDVPHQSLSPDEKLQQLHDQIDEANNHINEQTHQQLVASITDKHKKCADLEIDVKRLKKKYSFKIKELYQLKATIAENEEKLKALIGK